MELITTIFTTRSFMFNIHQVKKNIYIYIYIYILPEDCFNNMKLLVAIMWIYVDLVCLS